MKTLTLTFLVACLTYAAAFTPLAETPASAQTQGTWTYTGNLTIPRLAHTATLLRNGKVLVAGGAGNGISNSAELYDPETDTWSVTGSLNLRRIRHTATLLGNGKVLVTGGFTAPQGPVGVPSVLPTNRAELYDPATGTWSFTGDMNTGRAWHSATLLQNGKVLVAGGLAQAGYNFYSNALATAELYDPATGIWSVTGSPQGGRVLGTATLLQSGVVLVAGGSDIIYSPDTVDEEIASFLNSAELYDPLTETWHMTGQLQVPRCLHTATILPNGKVLAAAGAGPYVGYFMQIHATSELFDPATGTWSYAGNLTSRVYHAASLLPNGQVIVAAGMNDTGGSEDNHWRYLNSAEIFDPTTGNWTSTANLNQARTLHTATLLTNGKVLVVGGFYGCCNQPGAAELYDRGFNFTPNPIDDPQFFIRQQYRDFLGREPEPAGLQFYLDILNGCHASDAECIRYTRGALSANFFRSPEFQTKGVYVMNLYLVAIGQRPMTEADLQDASKIERPHYTEFMTDMTAISSPNDRNGPDPAKKAALTQAFVQRAEIVAKYPTSTYPTLVSFGNALAATAGVSLSSTTQNAIAASTTRAEVLQIVAESAEVNTKFYQPTFVTMEYFGYLRRDPEDCHDPANWWGLSDARDCGFIYQNRRFNELLPLLGSDLTQNFMVRGFIESSDYRGRFGLP